MFVWRIFQYLTSSITDIKHQFDRSSVQWLSGTGWHCISLWVIFFFFFFFTTPKTDLLVFMVLPHSCVTVVDRAFERCHRVGRALYKSVESMWYLAYILPNTGIVKYYLTQVTFKWFSKVRNTRDKFFTGSMHNFSGASTFTDLLSTFFSLSLCLSLSLWVSLSLSLSICTHTDTQTQTHTQWHMYTRTHTHIQHTHTHTRVYTHTHAHTHTHTVSWIHTEQHIHACTLYIIIII